MRPKAALHTAKRRDIMGMGVAPCRQVGTADGQPLSTCTEEGGECMTDYEMIMIFLAILTLLFAVECKKSK